MSIFRTFDRIPCRVLSLGTLGALGVLAALANPAFARPATSDEACTSAIFFESTSKAELTGFSAARSACYRIDIPEAGWLWVQATVPVRAVAEPRIQRLEGCDSGSGGGVSVARQTAQHMLLRSSAAESAVVCVGAQDPRLQLERYTLATVFLPQIQMDPELIEIEPEQQSSQPVPADPELIEIEPEQQSSAPDSPAACRFAVQDDHADTYVCATSASLGSSIRGRLQHDDAPDHDYIAFRVDSLRTVRLMIEGETDLLAGLYDERGRRLASLGESDRRAAIQVTRTLERGTYFVRVEGAGGSEGAYALSLSEVSSLW